MHGDWVLAADEIPNKMLERLFASTDFKHIQMHTNFMLNILGIL